jgi:hypothetical protein
MAHRRPLTPEDEEDAATSPAFTRILVIAFMTAASLGLLCGIAWVAYHVLWLHGSR